MKKQLCLIFAIGLILSSCGNEQRLEELKTEIKKSSDEFMELSNETISLADELLHAEEMKILSESMEDKAGVEKFENRAKKIRQEIEDNKAKEKELEKHIDELLKEKDKLEK
jgi:DNA repair exonuclease SbcCD ATPase subunit